MCKQNNNREKLENYDVFSKSIDNITDSFQSIGEKIVKSVEYNSSVLEPVSKSISKNMQKNSLSNEIKFNKSMNSLHETLKELGFKMINIQEKLEDKAMNTKDTLNPLGNQVSKNLVNYLSEINIIYKKMNKELRSVKNSIVDSKDSIYTHISYNNYEDLNNMILGIESLFKTSFEPIECIQSISKNIELNNNSNQEVDLISKDIKLSRDASNIIIKELLEEIKENVENNTDLLREKAVLNKKTNEKLDKILYEIKNNDLDDETIFDKITFYGKEIMKEQGIDIAGKFMMDIFKKLCKL